MAVCDRHRLRADAADAATFPNASRRAFKGRWIVGLAHGKGFALLITIVIAGVVLQVVNQFVSAYGTQVQVDTGQRMVYDLRYRLFEHLTNRSD